MASSSVSAAHAEHALPQLVALTSLAADVDGYGVGGEPPLVEMSEACLKACRRPASLLLELDIKLPCQAPFAGVQLPALTMLDSGRGWGGRVGGWGMKPTQSIWLLLVEIHAVLNRVCHMTFPLLLCSALV